MTHMLQSIDELSKIQYLTGNEEILLNIPSIPALHTWDERTIGFLGELSRNLIRDPRTKMYPDVTSYAFWIRNASLHHIKTHYYPYTEDKIGRGMAFHIAPSNVPVNFAVSFTSALLAGNISVVRISDKKFEQVAIIVDALKNTFANGYEDMEDYLLIIRYNHDDKINKFLSSICDIRIIWGGDQTINRVRNAALPPRAIEMTFADRHSIAILDSDAVMLGDVNKLARDFYTDTYYIDQNACSSPRIVIWTGKQIETAKIKFWEALEKMVKQNYEFKEIFSIDKFDQFCRLASVNDNVSLIGNNNLVMRIQLKKLSDDIMNYKCGGGYFFEYDTDKFEEIVPLFDKRCQTVSYYGTNGHELQKLILDHGVRGGDRIVPVGKTMDLTFKWDGFDMIESMSRYVYCPNYIDSSPLLY